MTDTPRWYQDGVIYQVAVHSYQDSNGDGWGDLPGLTARIDYLDWLGIDAIWIMPVFPSPMKDGGYDVSDFGDVKAEYGTMNDLKRFVDAAHERGIRVISDFLLNHTSDQHPWFVEARKPDSKIRDWYVWSDTADALCGVRIIFTDTHDSNWTWDDEAGAYYWHRFFDHQPDLNYDNPAVREAMMEAIRGWLALGIDGLRLDAAAYLYEREGTSGENLPETHQFLKEVRHMVDTEFPDAMLLAEVNQWPDDLVAYFGDSDECHMAFNFPVMPRLFMALATGDVEPVRSTIDRTPTPPPGCQWAVFLRNHDELSLEMVDDDELDQMYAAYAPRPEQRKNRGIKRRLAPLLGGDQRKIEMITAVLLSLPGTPVLYYGDEIGMGDMVSLDDRDSVRTPMQWDSSHNGGWSTAGDEAFYLPVVNDPDYAPAVINVHAQQSEPASMLTAIRAMLDVRRDSGFGSASFTQIPSSHASVLSFRRGGIAVYANFGDRPVDVGPVSGELLAGVAPDREGRLPAYGWCWIRQETS